MNDPIHQLFANRNAWRHLPSSQLERRAGVLFSVYFPEYLKQRRGLDLQMIIPDFPVPVGAGRPLTDYNKMFKVDYFVKVNNPSMVILIELRRDTGLARWKQDWHLAETKKRGIRQLLLGLKKVGSASSSKGQIEYLLQSLECAGLIKLSGKTDFRVLDVTHEISTIYIEPGVALDSDVITFTDMADFVGEQSDDLSQRFARSLREWAMGSQT